MQPGGLTGFVFAIVFLFPCFTALALWNWWKWRER